MADNVMDYQVMLADMEAKKAVLEQAIASLRAAIALGALGVSGDVQIQPLAGGLSLVGSSALIGSSDIPKDAFFNKSIPEAITLYLQAVRKKSTFNEIAQGLKKGGIESTAKSFDLVVRNTLYRLKGEGKVLLFADGWGLPEWYPEGLRSRVDQKSKTQEKKRGPKKKKNARTTRAVSEKPAAKESSKVTPISKAG